MHPFNEAADELLNHTGDDPDSKHGKFSLHYRFMDLVEERSLLDQCRTIVGSDSIARADETKARLLSMSYDVDKVSRSTSPRTRQPLGHSPSTAKQATRRSSRLRVGTPILSKEL